MFTIGSHIKDPAGNDWQVLSTWIHEEYLCVSLFGVTGPTANMLGGARFKQGDPIFIRPRN